MKLMSKGMKAQLKEYRMVSASLRTTPETTHRYQQSGLNYRYVDLLKFLEAPLVNVRRNI